MFTSHTDDIHVTSLCIAIYGLRITDIYRLGVLQERERERERGGGKECEIERGEREKERVRERRVSFLYRKTSDRCILEKVWRRARLGREPRSKKLM